MIDPRNPIVRELTRRGYRLAAHAYLRGERVKFTFVATHQGGSIVQGWSGGGGADDALHDLARRGGFLRRGPS